MGTSVLSWVLSWYLVRDLRCGTWALQLWFEGLVAREIACGILVPQVGIEPASPALQGEFFTSVPPGKSQIVAVLLVEG